MAKQQTEREVLVLNRYAILKDFAPKGLHKGDVVLHIRNDKGIEYYTTLRRNKAHSCLCKSVKPCYHIKLMVLKENTRYAANKAVKVIETAAQEVERKQAWDRDRCILIFTDTREPVDPQAYEEMMRPQREAYSEERMFKAALTQNKAFSII